MATVRMGAFMNINRRHIRIAACSIAIALLLQIAPVSAERKHDRNKPVEITFDPRYLTDALKTLDPTAPVTAELIDHKNAAVFKTEDQYTYVVMPLTRDR